MIQSQSTGKNPIHGESEGYLRRERSKKMYRDYARSGLEGSMDSGKDRSRSRSKRARLEAAKKAGPEGVSFVDLMRNSPDYQRNRKRSAEK